MFTYECYEVTQGLQKNISSPAYRLKAFRSASQYSGPIPGYFIFFYCPELNAPLSRGVEAYIHVLFYVFEIFEKCCIGGKYEGGVLVQGFPVAFKRTQEAVKVRRLSVC